MQTELEQLNKERQRFEERQEKEERVRVGSFGLPVGWLCAGSVVQSVVWSFGHPSLRSVGFVPVWLAIRLVRCAVVQPFNRPVVLFCACLVDRSIIRSVVDRSRGRWVIRSIGRPLGHLSSVCRFFVVIDRSVM